MLVGEVGISRDEFLYVLKMWEIIAIQRGYHRRCSRRWEPARFVAFCTVKAMGGGKNLNSVQDLIKFPWENDEPGDQPTQEEIKALQELVNKENEEFLRKQREQESKD